MTKRRLTQQQQQGVRSIQARKRHSIQKETDSPGAGLPGRVIAHHGQSLEVEAEDGQVVRCFVRQNIDPLVTGDRVIWSLDKPEDKTGVIVAAEPRTSILERPDLHHHMKLIAANIDQIFVVAAVEPEPVPYFIDKYLVAAEHYGIKAIIVLNKVDLGHRSNLIDSLRQRYHDIGYTVITCSAKNKDSLKSLQDALTGHISIFLGQSGVVNLPF